MNIALVVIDTLRYDYIGANGNTWIETPNIDRFAAKAWALAGQLVPSTHVCMPRRKRREKLLDALESTGLDQNTAVILTGDHGTNVGERGTFGKGQPVREAEAHVPLFIRMPDGDTGRSDVMVQPQDFFSTILAILGETEPGGIEGCDILTPARRGEAGQRQLALAGGSLERWNQAGQHPNFVLFTACAGRGLLVART